MKQFTISLLLFLLILSSSQAQRGWCSFDQFGWVIQIYQSADDSLWVIGVDGTWQLDDQGWHQETQVTGIVNSIYQEPNGTLWMGGLDVV